MHVSVHVQIKFTTKRTLRKPVSYNQIRQVYSKHYHYIQWHWFGSSNILISVSPQHITWSLWSLGQTQSFGDELPIWTVKNTIQCLRVCLLKIRQYDGYDRFFTMKGNTRIRTLPHFWMISVLCVLYMHDTHLIKCILLCLNV